MAAMRRVRPANLAGRPALTRSVNPTAVNEDFNVFTENRRDGELATTARRLTVAVTLITMPPKDGAPERKVALVAVGAMLCVVGYARMTV